MSALTRLSMEIEDALPQFGVLWQLIIQEAPSGPPPDRHEEPENVLTTMVLLDDEARSNYQIRRKYVEKLAYSFASGLDKKVVSAFLLNAVSCVGIYGCDLDSWAYDKAAEYILRTCPPHDLRMVMHPAEIVGMMKKRDEVKWEPASLCDMNNTYNSFAAFMGLQGTASVYSAANITTDDKLSSHNFLFHPTSAAIQLWPIEYEEEGKGVQLYLPFRLSVIPDRIVELRGIA